MTWHLAQLNLARLRAPLDSPAMVGFTENVARINALAERSVGFVWRLQEDDPADATAERPFGPEWLVNMSVWENVEALRAYVYRSAHGEFLRRRAEWFLRSSRPTLTLWWIAAGTLPTLQEARLRLDTLDRRGPSPDAFHFGQLFAPPDADQQGASAASEPD